MTPESNEPSSAVTVWFVPSKVRSLLVHVTVSPT